MENGIRSDFQNFISLWNVSSIWMQLHIHHNVYIFLLYLKFGKNWWKDKKRYSDLKMANIISHCLSISLRTSVHPYYLYYWFPVAFWKMKYKLIWLIVCVRIYKLFSNQVRFYMWIRLSPLISCSGQKTGTSKLFWSAGLNIYSFKQCTSILKLIDILHQMIPKL